MNLWARVDKRFAIYIMEKKILCLLFSVLVLSSCGSIPLPAPHSDVVMIDYSSLTQDGYFVTESNSVSFDYEAVGSIIAEEVGGWLSKNGKPKSVDPKDEYYISFGRKQIYQEPDLQKAYENLKNKLKEVGANGIINLDIRFVQGSSDKYPKPDKIIITGMAIKK